MAQESMSKNSLQVKTKKKKSSKHELMIVPSYRPYPEPLMVQGVNGFLVHLERTYQCLNTGFRAGCGLITKA